MAPWPPEVSGQLRRREKSKHFACSFLCDEERVVIMSNLRGIAAKLQTALCKKGIFIKINQAQSYSEISERMVTKYMLIKTEKENGKSKNTTILETYRLAEAVKLLADMYEDGG
nr:MAG TPA: hypothetical protein [Caudoviricetes sp.]